jgi:hypothetical protein
MPPLVHHRHRLHVAPQEQLDHLGQQRPGGHGRDPARHHVPDV